VGWAILVRRAHQFNRAHEGRALSAVFRADGGRERFYGWFAAGVGRPLGEAGEVPEAVRRALAEIKGRGLQYDLDRLGGFERSVLSKTREIPRGEVRSYAWVAREIGGSGAVRAVGTALRHNPFPLLIPCHRAVGGTPTSGGYRWGMQRKQALLLQERQLTLRTKKQSA